MEGKRIRAFPTALACLIGLGLLPPLAQGRALAGDDASCAALAPAHTLTPDVAAPAPAGVSPQARIFAVQFHQDVRNVASYDTYATKLHCVMDAYVKPYLAPGVPNIVVFNEEFGLMTVAIGSRGEAVRAWARTAGRGAGVTAPQGIPAGAAGGIGLAAAAYAPQIAYYQSKFPGAVSQGSFLLAATDTMVRSFASDLSQIASEYGVYVIANDNLPDFVESADPADVGALHDPDLTSRYLNGDLSTVYVATEPQVYNTAFVWAPALDCSVTSWAWACTHADVAGPLRNLLAKNLKVNLVNEETQDLAITAGPYTTQNLQPVTIPVTGGTLRLGIATSLDAFEYDPCGTDAGVGGCASTSPLSEPPAPRGGYCAAGENVYYMECLNALGTNILIQPEANGPWASPGGGTDWQPMDWMGSAFRAVAEQAGDWRIQYSVNPFLVGNLLDLPFDGQSAIFHRTTSGAGAHYIGDETLNASDPQADGPYAGSLPQFLALAPWVGQLDPAAPSGGDDRSWDQGYSASMEPGSGVACSASGAEYGACEDGYLETAVWADITGIS